MRSLYSKWAKTRDLQCVKKLWVFNFFKHLFKDKRNCERDKLTVVKNNSQFNNGQLKLRSKILEACISNLSWQEQINFYFIRKYFQSKFFNWRRQVAIKKRIRPRELSWGIWLKMSSRNVTFSSTITYWVLPDH